jgi:hypothetical protein
MQAGVTFEMQIVHSGRSIPEWKFRSTPVLVNVTLDALEGLFGPPGELTPDQVLDRVRASVEQAAQRKIDNEGEGFKEPVTIDVQDRPILRRSRV